MTDIQLNLVVIRASNLERTTAFYRLLGLDFVKHRHGNGLEHFAIRLLVSWSKGCVSGIIKLSKLGVPLTVIQGYIGHKSLYSVSQYIEVEQEAVNSAVCLL